MAQNIFDEGDGSLLKWQAMAVPFPLGDNTCSKIEKVYLIFFKSISQEALNSAQCILRWREFKFYKQGPFVFKRDVMIF